METNKIKCKPLKNKRKERYQNIIPSYHFAEREGFEPPDPRRSAVFKTVAIDHSATSPVVYQCIALIGSQRDGDAKIRTFFECAKKNILFIRFCHASSEGKTETEENLGIMYKK